MQDGLQERTRQIGGDHPAGNGNQRLSHGSAPSCVVE
jgi:hypothetical protein